jgi:hypothetical protein
MSKLVAFVDEFRARDAALLIELGQVATPVVKKMLAARAVAATAAAVDAEERALAVAAAEASAAVTPEALITAFCQHTCNSMTVLSPGTMADVGMVSTITALFGWHQQVKRGERDANCGAPSGSEACASFSC